MKYKADKIHTGQYAVCTGSKYFLNTVTDSKEEAEKLLKDKGDQKDFAEASSQLTQSLSQLRAIEALKKNIKLKK